MNKSNELRKLVRNLLLTLPESYGVKEVSYMQANDGAMFPHIVFSMSEIMPDEARDDYALEVDVFDKGSTYYLIEDLSDDVEDLFRCSNQPCGNILPTFFFESRRPVPDEDKSIKHMNLVFVVQNYTKGGK